MKTRSILALSVASCLFFPAAGFAAAGESRTVTLPSGTPIRVELTSTLQSKSARPGEKFSFRVASDVRSGGSIVVAAGAVGTGEVASVESAMNHEPGSLGLQFDSVSAVDGQMVALKPALSTAEGRRITGAAAHRWAPGREAVITPDMQFSTSVNTALNVRVDQTAEIPITH